MSVVTIEGSLSRFRLAGILRGDGSSPNEPLDSSVALRTFQAGLQDLLVLLASVQTSLALRRGEVPAGLTARLETALTNPTLGGLFQLLLWSAREASWGGSPSLSRYLDAEEKSGQGLLGTLVQLRNRWTHPQGETPEEVLRRAAALLGRMPPFFFEERLETHPEGEAFWIEADDLLPLSPWVEAHGGFISMPRGLSLARELLLDAPDPDRQKRFRDLWREARVRDRLLASPAPDELREKARRVAGPWTGAPPWWFEEIGSAGAPALLVTPEAIPGVLAAVVRDRPEMTPIQLTVEDGAALPQAMASRLGLGSPPEVAVLCGLSPASSPLVLAVGTTGLTSRGFLDLLFWLSDLVAADPKPTLRLLLARSEAELANDQDRLWDRLPEDLSILFRRPPRSGGDSLASFLWPDRRPKRFGIF